MARNLKFLGFFLFLWGIRYQIVEYKKCLSIIIGCFIQEISGCNHLVLNLVLAHTFNWLFDLCQTIFNHFAMFLDSFISLFFHHLDSCNLLLVWLVINIDFGSVVPRTPHHFMDELFRLLIKVFVVDLFFLVIVIESLCEI
jgi:hypothetical protein